jgi:TolB-like protein
MSELLGHYKVLDRIGGGAIGESYRARDTKLGRTVAITEVSAAITPDPESRARFLQETRAALVLSHPNIAALYEVAEDQGDLFLVREFVPGHALTTEIGGRPMNPRRAIDLAAQIADALADAHAAGIVHRQINPDTIVVTPKGNAKVVGFGLAAWTPSAAAMPAAAYLSPEQTAGDTSDHRSDIFSLGVVLFEMLTGRPPFTGRTTEAVSLEIAQANAPAVTSINRSLPPELDAILSKALAKRPDARGSSAATMAAALRSVVPILDARVVASEPPAAAVVRPRRGIPVGRIATVAVFALLAAATWWQRSTIVRLSRHAFGAAPAPFVTLIPFDSDPTQAFFADGFTDDLATRLGQTPGLKVLGRSATRQHRGRVPRDVARESNAAAVLTGSIRRSGDQTTVAVSLVDPRDDAAIWTGQYARDAASVFAIQAQIAEDVAGALHVKLEPTASSERARSRIVDPRAYEAYLHGRQAAADGRLPDARRFYEQAVQLDDGLAEAYAGLAEELGLEPNAGMADDPTRHPRLALAAQRALELAPDSPQANLAMALAADHVAEALAFLKKSITIDPSYSTAYERIGDEIADVDPDRALAFYRHALVLDPRMTTIRGRIVSTLAAAGRDADAVRELDAAAGTGAPLARTFRVGFALDQHQFAAALGMFGDGGRASGNAAMTLQYANALRGAGRADDARAVAGRLVQQDRNDCAARATLAALTFDHGQTAAARQLVADTLRSARTEDIGPLGLRCVLFSAAAVGDGALAGSVLNRIATDERLRREWALNILGVTGARVLRAAPYPWSRVADLPPVVEGRRALERAGAKARQQAADALADVTPAAGAPRP